MGDGKYVLDLHFSPGSDEATWWQVEGANGRSAIAFYLAAATRTPTGSKGYEPGRRYMGPDVVQIRHGATSCRAPYKLPTIGPLHVPPISFLTTARLSTRFCKTTLPTWEWKLDKCVDVNLVICSLEGLTEQ